MYAVTSIKTRISALFGAFALLAIMNGPESEAARAQNEAGPLTIHGTVRIPGSGAPFAGATVRLGAGRFQAAAQVTTTADAGGRFSFTGLAPGRYSLLPIDPGTDLAGAASRIVELTRDGIPTEVQLWMAPFSTVSGRVLDPDDEPVARAIVRVGALEWFEGQRVLAVVQREVRTDDDGRYTLPVTPGEYRLQVLPDRQSFPPHYYPGVVYPGDAIPFRVAAGVDLFGMDVSLTDSEQFRVRFRLPLAPELARIHASFGRADLPVVATVRFLGPGLIKREVERHSLESPGDDTYLSGPLPAGDYEMWLGYTFPGSEPLNPIVRFGFALEDQDLDLGTIEPGVYPDIPGRVVVRYGEAADRIDPARLPEIQFSDPTVGLSRYAPVAEDGTFLLQRLPPGVFRLFPVRMPANWPDGWYIASATSGGRDILKDGLLVGDGRASPVEIVIAEGAARIEGVARDSLDDLIPGARVVLIPPAVRRGPRTRFPTAVAAETGAWSLGGVPPGEYRVLAVDVAGFEDGRPTPTYSYWEDPGFLRAYELQGERITVDPGARMVVNAEAISIYD